MEAGAPTDMTDEQWAAISRGLVRQMPKDMALARERSI